MSKPKPAKPTESFGYIAFGKDGSVVKHTDRLSSDKETQELDAVCFFKEGVEKHFPDVSIRSVRQLTEHGHDFLLETSFGQVTVQLTELVERAYAYPLTKDEYDKGLYKEYIQKESGAIPWGVDTERRDSALYRVIEKKVQKRYAKDSGEELWLIVFTTSAYYRTEYFEAGHLRRSTALLRAREYLRKLQQPVFDQVWFTNLLSAPIRIWPYLNEESAGSQSANRR